MRSLLYSTALALLAAITPQLDAKVEASAMHLHSWLYKDLDDQPLIRINIHCDKAGVKLEALRFKLKGTSAIKGLNLYLAGADGKSRLFSLNAERAQEKCVPLRFKAKISKSTATFSGNHTLQQGDNYIWLAADTTSKAKGSTAVDAELIDIKSSDEDSKVTAGAPKGELLVYPYEYRVVPYYRDTRLLEWAPDLLTEEDFKYLTDIIYFRLEPDNAGNLKNADSAGFIKGIDKLKKLRGDEPVAIILGIAGNDPGFTATAGNPNARRNFARQIAAFMEKHDINGVDIDWEYPDNADQWVNFALMINDIREEVGACGRSISAAVNMSYMSPTRLATDMVDFVNVMCYDRPQEHSTMAHHKEETERSLKMMPRQKVIMGLPFYSNDIAGTRDWDAAAGYDGIIKENPRLGPGDNYAQVKGKRQYFNGVRLITEKCRHSKSKKIGGVMIWAYDCDIPMKERLSLRRALFSEIRRDK